MNPTAYTNLESLFLLQLLQKYGFTNGIFNRLSAELKVNSLLREQDGYDAGRLSPESLQEHLFQLIRDDPALLAQQDAHESNGHPPGLSPTSKKRKLSSPAQPTLQAFAQSDRLPGLVDKLYKRYRDDVVRAIKEDESRIELLVREIRDLETAEKAEKIAAQQERKAATVNGNAAAAAADDAKNVKPPPKPNGQAAQTPVPVPTPSQQPNLNVKTATPGPAPPPQNQAPPRASVLLSSQQPVKTATQPQSQPQGIVKGQSQGQPQSQPPGQPQGQPQVQPPAQPQNQPPAQPQAQPPAQPQAQPPAQSQAQPLAQSQAQPPAQSQGPDRRGAHPSPSPVPQNVRPPSVRPNNVGTPPNGTPSGLQHPQAAQAYGPPPTSASPQPHFAEAPRSQTPGIGAGARASPQPQSGSQLKWEPPYRPQQSPVPPAGGVPSRPAYTQQPARPPPSYPNQPQSGGHAQHPQHQLPHAAQPHAHTQYPQNFAPNRQTPQPPASSARTPTPVASQPSHPVLLPPQNAGQMPPSLSSLPANATPDGSGHQPPHPRTSVAPTTSGPATASPAPHYNPPQTHQHPSQQPARPPPLASPQVSTPVRAPNGPFPGGQRPPVPIQQPPHYHQGQGTPSAPSTPLAQHQDGPSRHFGTPQQSPAKQVTAPDQTKRPVSGHAKPPATAPPAAQSRPPSQMSFQTPVKTPSALNISTHVIRGHGTRWISTPTAATPRMEMTGYFDLQSPAVEPVSPPNVPAQLPKTASSQSSTKKEARKAIQRIDTSVTRPRSRLSQSAQIAPSSEEHSEAGADSDAGGQKIKDEEATPKAFDDNVMGAEDHGALPMSALSRGNKRKRLESPEDRMPAAPPTHVLWTRSFNKVSAQALEQIISHRHANMFAGPVKARDAPGYNDIVMQPLDLKKVRAAINHGQRMAQAVEKTLSDIDPNAMNVWLPISVDLVPPKGIINIAQLERELVHMFVNAIMYAPDAERGFGQTFLRQPSDRKQGGDGASEDGDDDDNDAIIGYEVDENGLVKETRNMFLEVEKLLGDLRSEVERNAQPKGMGRLPSMSRSVSAVGGEANTGEEEDDEAAGEADSFNTAKRRRTRG